ncbi:MAG: topology modulation protein [Clostridia bacterium]|nr:topology modulation protein [Clostridia bacterium]
MKRVLVIGGNGAGKSYFSVKLSEKTGLPLVHLDRLFWRENRQSVPREEFDRLLAEELAKDSWIIDGNFQRTLPVRLERADTVFLFDFSTVKCFFGVLGRVIRGHGKTRPDMGGGNKERLDFKFLGDVIGFRKRNRKKTSELLKSRPDVEVTVFRSRRQAEKYLDSLPEKQ